MKKQAKAFDVAMCGRQIGDAVVGMTGFESNRVTLNGALKEAYIAKAIWGQSRNEEGSLAQAIWLSWEITRPDVTESTKKVDLTVLKKCYTLGIQVECLSSGGMNKRIKDGATYDLISGEKKVIKPKGDKKSKSPKSEKLVKHCGYGMLAAIEQEGFLKFFNHLLNKMEMMSIDVTDLDEIKLDCIKSALVDTGFVINGEGGLEVKAIVESDNESEAEE